MTIHATIIDDGAAGAAHSPALTSRIGDFVATRDAAFAKITDAVATLGKARFQRVGGAIPQSEGAKSVMNIQLDSLSPGGELVLFEPRSGDNDDNVTD